MPRVVGSIESALLDAFVTQCRAVSPRATRRGRARAPE
jgi:hypothetical protein